MVAKEAKKPKGRLVPHGHYEKQFISKVVAEVLKGKHKRVVQLKYGLKRSTLNGWLKAGDLMIEPRRIGPRANIGFKRTVVQSVTSGRLSMQEP